jgi:hypothetical protein
MGSGVSSALGAAAENVSRREAEARARQAQAGLTVTGHCELKSPLGTEPCFHVALLVKDASGQIVLRALTEPDGTFELVLPEAKEHTLSPASSLYEADTHKPWSIHGGENLSITLRIKGTHQPP